MISMQKNHQIGQFFKKTNATWDEKLSHPLRYILYLKSYPILTQTPPLRARPDSLCFLMHSELPKSPSCKPTLSSGASQQPKAGRKVGESVKFGRADSLCALVNPPLRHCDTGEPQPLLAPQRLYKECKTTPNYFSPTPTWVRQGVGGRWSEVTSSAPYILAEL